MFAGDGPSADPPGTKPVEKAKSDENGQENWEGDDRDPELTEGTTGAEPSGGGDRRGDPISDGQRNIPKTERAQQQ